MNIIRTDCFCRCFYERFNEEKAKEDCELSSKVIRVIKCPKDNEIIHVKKCLDCEHRHKEIDTLEKLYSMKYGTFCAIHVEELNQLIKKVIKQVSKKTVPCVVCGLDITKGYLLTEVAAAAIRDITNKQVKREDPICEKCAHSILDIQNNGPAYMDDEEDIDI